MAAISSEITNSILVKKIYTAAIASNWAPIYGDLEEIFNNEDSREIALFEKIINKEAEKSTAKTTDTKTSDEGKQQFKILQIMIRRCKETAMNLDGIGYNTPNYTGKRPIFFFAFWGDGTRRESTCESLYIDTMFHGSSLFQELQQSNFSEPTNTVCRYFRRDTASDDQSLAVQDPALQSMAKEGRFFFKKYMGFKTGMREATLHHLFNSFQESGFSDPEDVKFLNTISLPRNPSLEEIQLNAQLKLALDTKKYEEAIQIVRNLHKLFRQEAKVIGSPGAKWFHGKYYPTYIDEGNAAIQLATLVRALKPELAIKALEILTAYEGNQTEFGESNARYFSPYAEEASKKIAEIQVSMLEENIPEAEKRKLRSKAIEMMFINLLNDGTDWNSGWRHIARLMKALCGSEDLNEPSQESQKKIELKDNDDAAQVVLLKMHLLMMQEISDLKQEVKTLKEAAKEKDVKQRSESETVQQSSPVVPSSTTSLTYIREARDAQRASSNNQPSAEGQLKKDTKRLT